jgi:aminoglycoside phosphotransferase (APT) family kinase protein
VRAEGGRRLEWGELPGDLRAWVESVHGPVTEAVTQTGGMSAGCALRLDRTHFLKAVSEAVNADTVALFRYEARVLAALAPVPWRASLVASYDDDGWVGLLLEDVDGRHPDLDDETDWDLVSRAVGVQCAELAVAPDIVLTSVQSRFTEWLPRWDGLAEDPAAYLPAWAADRFDELHARVRSLIAKLAGDALCHWDLREDNILVRPDGQVGFVDWGMSRRAPSWFDPLVLAQHHVQSPRFDEVTRGLTDPDVITDVLVMIGGSQAFMAKQPAPPGLPTMPAFRAADAARTLEGARRRL